MKPELNDYHKERNKKAIAAVKEMQKRPLTFDEAKADLKRRKDLQNIRKKMDSSISY